MRMFRWDREPDPKWVQTLGEMTPPREHLSHLTIQWVPIAKRRLAQRWVIFDCIPFQYAIPYISSLTEDDLVYDPMIHWAWQYCLKHNAFPMPFWVCQGSPMGHPYGYNVIEKAQSSVGLLPSQPPMVGELAYSEPSALTWEAIRRRSAINRKLKHALDERERVKEQAQRDARKTLLAQVEAGLADVIDETKHDVLANHARTVDVGAQDKANVTQDTFDEYIETGVLPHLN
jgi:hypothetical protein